MFNRCISVVVAALLFLPGFASAEVPNYKYFEASFVTGEADADGIADFDQDGFRLDLSGTLLDDRLWLFSSYTKTDGDEGVNLTLGEGLEFNGKVDVDVGSFQAGAGYILELFGNTTVDFSARYRQDDFDIEASLGGGGSVTIPSDEAKGFGVAVGVRSNIFEFLEIFARVGALSGDYDNTPTVDLGATWNIGELFGITAAYEYVDVGDKDFETELTSFRIGARARF
jgi:hypothetical protein